MEVPEAGKVALHVYQATSGRHLFMIQDAMLAKLLPANQTNAMLDAVVTSFGSSLGGAKVSSGPMKFQGFPGRSMVFDKGNARIKAITVLAGRHSYTVVFGGPPADVNGADAKRFFASFKILQRP